MNRSSTRRLMLSLVAVLVAASVFATTAGASDREDSLFERIRVVYRVVSAYHKSGADLDVFVDGAIRGGLEALGDQYTNYYTTEEFGAFLDSLNGSFSGIGAYLEQVGNYVVVSAPIKDSPAERAGIRTGDRILEVNGTPVIGFGTEQAVSLIRGEAGTEVTLKLERPSEDRTFTVTVVRAVINIPEVTFRMLEPGLGYVQVASFGDNAAREFFKAVESLKAEGAESLVLDLRQNPGGYVDSALEIASGFVPAGEPVLHEYTKTGIKTFKSAGNLIHLPTVVLVDGGSASATEILVGAIQDYKAATVVGTQTFGKGTVQQLLTLNIGGGMKVTIAEYKTPLHREVDGVGLTPDILVEKVKLDKDRTSPLEYDGPITNGAASLKVLHLQYRLKDLGFDPETTGFFGLKTSEAVKQFAIANGLPVNTNVLVDARFMAKLNEQVQRNANDQAQVDVQLNKAIEILKNH